ncbi:prepilin-type N-terminal cleavage/methylation domain-containing protein [Pseudomonas asplenii]|uniref:prepilin-type N-terminal cleavage/methylation domain-containing protein n=1 Tax=Pseudomonas asplenii TaxID=53407 RepID=UPI00036F65D9|nr:type II secretion system protein [Pseudomonas fuscovaginae]
MWPLALFPLAPSRLPGAGFTLIELLLTLALLATLATVAYPLTALVGTREREADLQRSLREIRRAIDAYKDATEDGRVDKGLLASGYPPTLAALTEGVVDKRDPTGGKIHFLRRIPRDPFCDCPDQPAEKTWRLRSYRSSAENPAEGDDVFDVSSGSDKEGLNGSPYSTW